MNHRNENYWKYTETKGEIETKYTAFGTDEVSTAEWNADGKAWQKYEVWYPSELQEGNGTYPLVIMVNGTGESSATTLNFMFGLNEEKNSDFYGKFDTDNIGITGRSQGGVGAMNAGTVPVTIMQSTLIIVISRPQEQMRCI